MSTVGVIEKLCVEAVKDVVVATAAEMHKGDPVAASMAVSTALQSVLASQMMNRETTPGDPRTTRGTPDS